MEQDVHTKMALWWLAILRGGTIIYTDALWHLRKYINEGNLRLTDLGTTEVELEACRVQGCKLLALHWLQALRDGTIMYKTHILTLRRTIEEGGLHPEDIGSSEREIESFACVSTEEFARRLKRKLTFRFDQGLVANPR